MTVGVWLRKKREGARDFFFSIAEKVCRGDFLPGPLGVERDSRMLKNRRHERMRWSREEGQECGRSRDQRKRTANNEQRSTQPGRLPDIKRVGFWTSPMTMTLGNPRVDHGGSQWILMETGWSLCGLERQDTKCAKWVLDKMICTLCPVWSFSFPLWAYLFLLFPFGSFSSFFFLFFFCSCYFISGCLPLTLSPFWISLFFFSLSLFSLDFLPPPLWHDPHV